MWLLLQDDLHVTTAGGAGGSLQGGPLPGRLRPRDAESEDRSTRGQDTGERKLRAIPFVYIDVLDSARCDDENGGLDKPDAISRTHTSTNSTGVVFFSILGTWSSRVRKCD